MTKYCRQHFEESRLKQKTLITNRWDICEGCQENVRCDAEGNVRERFPIYRKDEPKMKKRIATL